MIMKSSCLRRGSCGCALLAKITASTSANFIRRTVKMLLGKRVCLHHPSIALLLLKYLAVVTMQQGGLVLICQSVWSGINLQAEQWEALVNAAADVDAELDNLDSSANTKPKQKVIKGAAYSLAFPTERLSQPVLR